MRIRAFFVFLFLLFTGVNTPALAQSKNFFGFDGFLLGAWIDGKWVKHGALQTEERYRDNRLIGGETCALYSSKGLIGKGVATAPHNAHPKNLDGFLAHVASMTDTFDVQLPKPSSDGFLTTGLGDCRLAASVSWNPIPRKATLLNPNHAVYKKVLTQYLEKQGIVGANPRLEQLFKVDIEGDGVDEVIMVAQNVIPPLGKGETIWNLDQNLYSYPKGPIFPVAAKKGNYALILLRKIINGTVREIPIASFINLKDTSTPEDAVVPVVYKVLQFADLNGDGILEVITTSSDYEGFGFSVHEIKGNNVKEVLSNGAGI